jgi:uncharacterized membrane protein YdjX (TVP38/TMEM64 family)
MPAEASVPKKRLPVAQLAVAAALLIAVAGVALYLAGWSTVWSEGRRLFQAALQAIAAAGPVVFYATMALLPVLPISPFAVMSGLVFRESLGLPVVLACGLLAMACNMALAYWLARRWLRPPVSRFVTRRGYPLPEIERGDATKLIVLLRLTPGPPFSVQNYLLGLAEVPFGRYLVWSCATQGALFSGLVVFGDALGQGKARTVMLAVGGVAAVVIGTRFVRKRLARKRTAELGLARP